MEFNVTSTQLYEKAKDALSYLSNWNPTLDFPNEAWVEIDGSLPGMVQSLRDAIHILQYCVSAELHLDHIDEIEMIFSKASVIYTTALDSAEGADGYNYGKLRILARQAFEKGNAFIDFNLSLSHQLLDTPEIIRKFNVVFIDLYRVQIYEDRVLTNAIGEFGPEDLPEGISMRINFYRTCDKSKLRHEQWALFAMLIMKEIHENMVYMDEIMIAQLTNDLKELSDTEIENPALKAMISMNLLWLSTRSLLTMHNISASTIDRK